MEDAGSRRATPRAMRALAAIIAAVSLGGTAGFHLCAAEAGSIDRPPVVRAGTEDGAVALLAKRRRPGLTQPLVSASRVAPVRIALPVCQGNDPNLAVPVQGMCAQAALMCSSTSDPSDVMFWIYQGPPGVAAPAPGQWRMAGHECRHAGRPTNRAVPALTLREFRQLPLPPSVIRIQPATLRTLVNIETNVYTESRPAILSTTLLGLPVRVRVTPVGYRWVFGDGSRLQTPNPGAPYPRMTTTHVYKQSGRYSVVLVTRYAGEYSVAGGPWLPVDGEAEVSSRGVSLTVVKARTHLVDGPLPELLV